MVIGPEANHRIIYVRTRRLLHKVYERALLTERRQLQMRVGREVAGGSGVPTPERRHQFGEATTAEPGQV